MIRVSYICKVIFSKLMTVSEKVLDVADDDPSRVDNSTAEIISNGNRMGVVRVTTDAAVGAMWNNATNLTAEYAAVAKNEANIPYTIVSNPQTVMGEPGTMGLAAAVMGDVANGGDYSLVARYADLDRQIWDAKGIDRMYGQQIDLITDPRWSRNVTTFTEDPEVLANIAVALVKGYQGSTDGLTANGVGLIMKHFPGDSASYNGFESHYGSGQFRMYAVENTMEKYFLPAFQAAVDAKVAGIMPCYSRPMPINANQTYRGVEINAESVGSAYNKTILQTLLRDTMGFEGFLNTDSGVLGTSYFSTAWGVDGLSIEARAAEMLNGGIDVIGEWWGEPIQYSIFLNAYKSGLMKEEALNSSVTDNVKSLFVSGRFENPYENVEESVRALELASAQTASMGEEISQKSIVLMKNHANVLPLKENGKKVFIASFTKSGNNTDKENDWAAAFTAAGYTIVDKADEADIALLDVAPSLNESGNAMNTLDLVDGIDVAEYDYATGLKTGEEIEHTTLMDVKRIARYADAVHKNGGFVIGTITINAPWILTNLEPYCDVLLGNFAASTWQSGVASPVTAQMNVLVGKYNPTGKLPVTMVSCNEVIATVETEIDGVVYDICVSPNDVPGYDKDQYIAPEVLAQSPSGSYAYQDADGNAYKAWFGLSY